MKRVGKPVFFVVALLILGFSYLAIFGWHGFHGDIPKTYIKGIEEIRWGIDIRGGVEAIFSPEDGVEATESEMKSVEETIKHRMVSNNITDYELFSDSKNNRIIVRFPWQATEKDFKPDKAIGEICQTALLTFREGQECQNQDYDSSGQPVRMNPAGITAETVLLEGKHVEDAKAMQVPDQTGNITNVIDLKFTAEGKEKFTEATTRLVGKTISIWMDDRMISSATVNQALTDGRGQITGEFTPKEAAALAGKIKAGALPFKLQTTNHSSISPHLGASALDTMLLAGIISFVLVCLMMLIFFRLPGFIACIALIGHLTITFAFISGFFFFINSFTLTLPGIAGIILSIGMGVDANIIIASRIKEELNNGKTLDKAIDSGSKSSFWAVFDGNVTVIIVALILMGIFGPANILSWLFGASTTGSIYSFGYTLLIGVICNFMMGMTATRLMTKSISGYKFARNAWLYGGSRKKDKHSVTGGEL
ncbi:MAG: protein translocase subunit SecD [Oscillospiraceae bacterium]|jgi:protein-export membrane protein SecD|nr:protein translocase subunit SecD [Oscillospiraceae bacterium]